MNINDSFPTKWLKAGHLDGDRTLTINDVLIERMGDDEEVKPVLYFQEDARGLVLNRTNAGIIEKLLGTSETDEWLGRQITIFPTQVDFGGKTTEAIRVRIRAPQVAARAVKDPSLFIDWTAFYTDRIAAGITPAQLTDLCEGRDPEKISVTELNIVWDGFRDFAARAKAREATA